MTNDDVVVATPPDETSEERPDRSLAEQLVEQARADGKNLVGPGGLLSDLTKQVLETGLEVEMEEHLGYPKHAVEGRNGGNSRNGTRSKTVITEIGPVELDVPRDRDGSFDPQTVRKNQRRLDGVDSMVISLTAKGLTTGEVEAHLAEVYGGSAIFQAECHARYITSCLALMLRDGLRSMEPRADVTAEYTASLDEAHEDLIWTHGGLRNWYRNDAGRVVAIMPWRLVDYWRMTHDPDLDDFVVR